MRSQDYEKQLLTLSCHVMSVCTSVRLSVTPNGRIFMKYVSGLLKTLLEKFKVY